MSDHAKELSPDKFSPDKFLATIADGLRHAIRDHGPITKELIGSAAKRVWARIKNTKYDPFKPVRPDGGAGEGLKDLINEFLWDKYACTIEHHRMKVLKHFVEWVSARTPAVAQPTEEAEDALTMFREIHETVTHLGGSTIEVAVDSDLAKALLAAGNTARPTPATPDTEESMKATYTTAHPSRYLLTHGVHPDIVVLFFLALKSHWFEDDANMFYGQREQAKAYLYKWVETGELADDNTVLEIATRMKFREWLESSWATNTPAPSSVREAALKIAQELDRQALLHNSNAVSALTETELEPITAGIVDAWPKEGQP